MSEGHDMSKPNEGHDVTTVAVVLNGDFPSLLEDMDEAEQQLVADELPWESLCFVLAVQCALLVLTEFSQQAQKRYEKKLRKQVKKGCKC